jgi:hypothetical protein
MSGVLSAESSADISDTHFQSVPAMTVVNYDTVVPDGETWCVLRFIGSAVYAMDAEVSLVWDPDGENKLLASTHGDADIPLKAEVVGNGAKKLRLMLDNAATGEHTLGGLWEVQKL